MSKTCLKMGCMVIVLIWGWTTLTWANNLTGKKVLVVNSYHSSSDAEAEIQQALEKELDGATFRHFFMDTKKHPEGGAAKAKEAYQLYTSFQPDVVITADDNVQSLFVLPYLKDKVTTPVVFCGVNDDASQYGYPTDQITGILEKKHYREGINFSLLINPKLKKIAVLFKDNPSNSKNIHQIKKEMAEYPVEIVDFVSLQTTDEVTARLNDLESRVDGLLVLNLAGISDPSGEQLNGNAAMTFVAERWPKMTIGASVREIKAGLLCGVAKLNSEQGMVAGAMARQILLGKAPADIPVTENRNGQRMINVKTAQRLGIPLKPIVLLGTNLVR